MPYYGVIVIYVRVLIIYIVPTGSRVFLSSIPFTCHRHLLRPHPFALSPGLLWLLS